MLHCSVLPPASCGHSTARSHPARLSGHATPHGYTSGASSHGTVFNISFVQLYLHIHTHVSTYTYMYSIPYSGYFWGGKIFMNSEFLASLWKYFHGRGILNHTPVLFMCKGFMVRLSTTKTMKILPPPKIPAVRYVHV